MASATTIPEAMKLAVAMCAAGVSSHFVPGFISLRWSSKKENRRLFPLALCSPSHETKSTQSTLKTRRPSRIFLDERYHHPTSGSPRFADNWHHRTAVSRLGRSLWPPAPRIRGQQIVSQIWGYFRLSRNPRNSSRNVPLADPCRLVKNLLTRAERR